MKEYIKGGKSEGMDCAAIAKKHGVSLETIEAQEKMGIKVEHEHTPDDGIAAEIARDHLAEFPTYYTGLAKMEEELKKQVKPSKKEDKKDKTEAEIAQEKKDALARLFG